jgi:hypothetical protein
VASAVEAFLAPVVVTFSLVTVRTPFVGPMYRQALVPLGLEAPPDLAASLVGQSMARWPGLLQLKQLGFPKRDIADVTASAIIASTDLGPPGVLTSAGFMSTAPARSLMLDGICSGPLPSRLELIVATRCGFADAKKTKSPSLHEAVLGFGWNVGNGADSSTQRNAEAQVLGLKQLGGDNHEVFEKRLEMHPVPEFGILDDAVVDAELLAENGDILAGDLGDVESVDALDRRSHMVDGSVGIEGEESKDSNGGRVAVALS